MTYNPFSQYDAFLSSTPPAYSNDEIANLEERVVEAAVEWHKRRLEQTNPGRLFVLSDAVDALITAREKK